MSHKDTVSKKVLAHPVAGASWEGFLIEQILGLLLPSTRTSFFRTATGSEVDLIIEKGNKRIAVEFKLSTAPGLSPQHFEAFDIISPSKIFLVGNIEDSYELSQGVTVSSISGVISYLRREGFLRF